MWNDEIAVLLLKAKRWYLLTCKVSRYCLLALNVIKVADIVPSATRLIRTYILPIFFHANTSFERAQPNNITDFHRADVGLRGLRNPYNAEKCLHKPWPPKGYFNF